MYDTVERATFTSFFEGRGIDVRDTRARATDNVAPDIIASHVQSPRTIDVIFSERIVYRDNLLGSDFTITNSGVNSTEIEIVSPTRDGTQTNTITLRVPASNTLHSSTGVQYTASTDRPIADRAGNTVPTDSSLQRIRINDDQRPRIDFAAVIGTDSIHLEFNESLFFNTVHYTDFRVTNPSATILDATVSGTVVTLTLAPNSLDLSSTPTVRVTGSVTDLAGLSLTGSTSVVAIDASPPTFTAERVGSGNSILIRLNFNQPVNSTSGSTAWTVEGHTVTSFTHTEGDNTAILRTSGNSSTDATPLVTYTRESTHANTIHNLAGIDMEAGTNATAIDSTRPEIEVTNVTSTNAIDHELARAGDTITITLRASELIEKPAISFF